MTTKQNDFSEVSIAELEHVTGGGWKSKVAKGAWQFAKWTGIPTAIGAGAAWAKRQISGPEQPQPPKQDH